MKMNPDDILDIVELLIFCKHPKSDELASKLFLSNNAPISFEKYKKNLIKGRTDK